MEKQNYEPPCTQTIIVLQEGLVCVSSLDGTFSNEGYGSDEEEFEW